MEGIQSGVHFETTRMKILLHRNKSKIGLFFQWMCFAPQTIRIRPGVSG